MQAALLWIASATAVLTWYVHTFVGGVHVARPLLADTGLPKAAKWLSYYCWHLVTLMLLGIAGLFGSAALGHASSALAGSLAVFCFACSALSIGVAARGRIAPWRFPSTSLFALMGAFGLAAAVM